MWRFGKKCKIEGEEKVTSPTPLGLVHFHIPSPPIPLIPSSILTPTGIMHILNAQVSIRAPCCKQWFDCPECHAETQTHPLARTTEMTFMCKKCKKAFRKDMGVYEESDEYCPHCDNHYVSPSADRISNLDCTIES